MAYIQPITVPPGAIRRQALEDVLKYSSDTQLVEQSLEEYRDMLLVEIYFSEIDPDKHVYLCKKYKHISVTSYTNFAKDLLEENKNSKLIKHIYGIYKSKQLALCQKAMLEYSLLKAICTAYEKQNKRENLSSTYSGTGNTQGLQTSTFQQTAQSTQSHRPTGVPDNAVVQINGQIFYPETMYKQLEHRALEQFKDIDSLQKDLKDANLQKEYLTNRCSGFASKILTEGNPDFTDLSDENWPTKHLKDPNLQMKELRNSAEKDTEMIKQLKQKTQDLSKLLIEERKTNERDRTKNQKEIIEKEKDITELRKEKARLKDETEQLKKEVNQIKNKAKKEVDKTETTASKPSDTSTASSSNRFAQCPIVEGQWSSEKDTELLSLQEQNKSYEESMMTMLKAKRIKEDENSKLKTKVQQLERDFLKKAKEVDSLKIVKQTLEERLNKQTKE